MVWPLLLFFFVAFESHAIYWNWKQTQNKCKQYLNSDSGHSHTDKGHSHRLKDAGEPLGFVYYQKDTETGSWKFDGSGNYINHYEFFGAQESHAVLSTDSSNIQIGTSGHPNAADETRPKNMIIEWVIKIC